MSYGGDIKIVGDVTFVSSFSNSTSCHRAILSLIASSLDLFYRLVILLSKYGHIKDFFVLNPDFITDQEHAIYRKNIFAGCGLCVVLMFLSLYAIVSIFL